MGFLTLTDEVTPSTPAAGRGSAFFDSADNGRLKVIRPDGLVYIMNMSGFDKNLLINGGFDLFERQAPGTLTTRASTTVRVYGPDRWGMTTGNAVTFQCIRVDTGSAPETGLTARFYGRFLQLTNAAKVAVSQVIEGHATMPLRGRKVRFQTKVKRVGSAYSIRLALVQLNSAGTIDTMPATFISAFNGAGTDPTFGTNLALIAPDANSGIGGTVSGNAITYAPTTGWTQVAGVWTIPSNLKNLVAVVYTDGLLAANDEVQLSETGLYDGPDLIDWIPMPVALDAQRAERFYEKTFATDVNPVTNAGVTTGCLRCILGKAAAIALAAQFQWRYRTPKRASGTITLLNPGAANAQVRQISGTAGDLTASASANPTLTSVDVTATGIATGAVGDQCGIHLTCDAEL